MIGEGKITIAFALLLLAAVAATAFVTCRQQMSPIDTQRTEYSGKILERWAGYSHSEQGSVPYFRLRVETENGAKIVAPVTGDVYERAQVGMWIEKRRSETKLGATKAEIQFSSQQSQN